MRGLRGETAKDSLKLRSQNLYGLVQREPFYDECPKNDSPEPLPRLESRFQSEHWE